MSEESEELRDDLEKTAVVALNTEIQETLDTEEKSAGDDAWGC